LYTAFQDLIDDCINKSEISKAYAEGLNKDIIDPLKALLQEQIDTQKSIDAKWKQNNKMFEEKKAQVSAANSKFFKTTAEVDDAMTSYEKIREAKDVTEEKKNRQGQKVTQLLSANKEAEKSYKSTVYSAKEMRNEYMNSLVTNNLSINTRELY